ncbi:MAG: hypothetical protein ACRCVI_00210 [Mycoplasmoidaceae bacterium]
MKKSKKYQTITLFMTSVIFVTTLTVFLSIILEQKKTIDHNNLQNQIKSIDLGKEVVKTKKINSLITLANNGNSRMIFSRELIKRNLYIVLEEAITLSNEINYELSKMYYQIFFKMISDQEISIKTELTPKGNYNLKYHSKFRLRIT